MSLAFLSSPSTMQHPNRPPSPQSIHSWWSDSKSLGPTISIHAAAKPLMKFMYHRQVRSFIKKNWDTWLYEEIEIMEICSSYLACKYVSLATKSLILNELNRRIDSREHARIHPFIRGNWSLVAELLSSDDALVRMHTFDILHSLGASSYDAVSWAFWICPRISAFIIDTNNIDLQCLGLKLITQMSATSDGAEALAGSTIWEYICDNQGSANTDIRQMISSIVRNLTMSNRPFISIAKDAGVEQHARRAIVDVKAREYVSRNLTKLVNVDPRRSRALSLLHWELLNTVVISQGNLYLDPELSPILLAVFLLGCNDRNVRRVAIDILWKLSHSLEAARAIQKTNILEYVPDLLEDSDLRSLTCEILGNISLHQRVTLDESTKEQLERLIGFA
ncbi:hypothetical protein R3P38DRAFT_2843693 [Favolaschia claudopus]|uniref:Uncharacterized protein n=1 Tax=Favolaschia claudopus TaxID=2862362 RepID=A0AAW0E0N9_9AGAR